MCGTIDPHSVYPMALFRSAQNTMLEWYNEVLLSVRGAYELLTD
jgi:hypothetical protein